MQKDNEEKKIKDKKKIIKTPEKDKKISVSDEFCYLWNNELTRTFRVRQLVQV